MKTVGITGGSGFIGLHLAQHLVEHGYHVIIFSRRSRLDKDITAGHHAEWNPTAGRIDEAALRSVDAVVNLAGASIAGKRWTHARKQELIESRISSTQFLVAQLRRLAPHCKVLVSASATGYYGADTADRPPFSEDAPPGNDFLASLCTDWEATAMEATDFARVVICRFGIVLGRGAGAFPSFRNPLRLGLLPVLGGGRQIVSWIQIADLTALLRHLLEQPVSGIFNGTAPQPVTQKELVKTIARELHTSPLTASAPAWVLKVALGELATELLKSCTVSSDKTRSAGFQFQFPDIKTAVHDLVR